MRTGVFSSSAGVSLQRLQSEGTPPIGVTTFHYGSEEVPVAIQPEHGVHHLYAPRRTVLDRILVEAAEAAGAEVQHGVAACRRFSSTRAAGSSAQGFAMAAAARASVSGRSRDRCRRPQFDGRQAGRRRDLPCGPRFVRLGLWLFRGPAGRRVALVFREIALRPASSRPTRASIVFSAACRSEQFGAALRGDIERGFLGLLEKLRSELERRGRGRNDAPVACEGFAGAHGFMRRPCGPGWALVGDAGYFKDPLTAHGITDALRDAELLARAMLGSGSHDNGRGTSESATFSRSRSSR